MLRINVGCGQTSTPGWRNYDNSMSVRLAAYPNLTRILDSLGVLAQPQREFISHVKRTDIRYANAVKRIPEASNSVEVLYTSHMVEHLDQEEVRSFLKEARRVLIPQGIIRIAVPDIKYHVDNYFTDGNADAFIEGTCLAQCRPKTLIDKAKYLLIGARNHLWMYDGVSLSRVLLSAGFENPQIMAVGKTIIPNPGQLNLAERAPESVFVEARNP